MILANSIKIQPFWCWTRVTFNPQPANNGWDTSIWNTSEQLVTMDSKGNGVLANIIQRTACISFSAAFKRQLCSAFALFRIRKYEQLVNSWGVSTIWKMGCNWKAKLFFCSLFQISHVSCSWRHLQLFQRTQFLRTQNIPSSSYTFSNPQSFDLFLCPPGLFSDISNSSPSSDVPPHPHPQFIVLSLGVNCLTWQGKWLSFPKRICTSLITALHLFSTYLSYAAFLHIY